jgi:hypothetical protein
MLAQSTYSEGAVFVIRVQVASGLFRQPDLSGTCWHPSMALEAQVAMCRRGVPQLRWVTGIVAT